MIVVNDYNDHTMIVLVWFTSQRSITGDIGTACSLLQVSSPVLRVPNGDVYAFLLLSGARPAGLDLLGNTRVGVVGVWTTGVGFLWTTMGSCLGSCFATSNSVLPLNSNPFLIFLFMTTSGHVSRIFPFIFSSANGNKDSSVSREYT